jgi:hypothetical protein
MILAADEDGNPEETVRVRAYDAEARARGEEGPFQVEYLDGPEMGNVMWETDTLITTSRLLAPSDALAAAPDLSDSPAAVWSTETEHSKVEASELKEAMRLSKLEAKKKAQWEKNLLKKRSESELSGMRVKELKQLLKARDIEHSHCVEKRELIALIISNGGNTK